MLPPVLACAAATPAAAALSAIASTIAASCRAAAATAGGVPAPVASLRRGDWVKLICGASFEDAADVRNLSLVYTLAGVDCIDCAADASVVMAVNEGIRQAAEIEPELLRPWVMVSVNDDRQDVHFRKAEFDPEGCPPDCPRPCESVCPANAISLKVIPNIDDAAGLNPSSFELQGGVITERCYGCGRCFPVCPYDRINALTYIRSSLTTSDLLRRDDVDAIEIHTSGKSTNMFSELWRSLDESTNLVKLVAVSLPYGGNSTIAVMNEIYRIMESRPPQYNIWQLDGRPMSGDIGRGATRETIAFFLKVAADLQRPPGFYQLAGGTNAYTLDSLKKEGIFGAVGPQDGGLVDSEVSIGGIAYGGYARKIVGRLLRKVPTSHIEDHPEFLLEALRGASALVGPVKGYDASSIL